MNNEDQINGLKQLIQETLAIAEQSSDNMPPEVLERLRRMRDISNNIHTGKMLNESKG